MHPDSTPPQHTNIDRLVERLPFIITSVYDTRSHQIVQFSGLTDIEKAEIVLVYLKHVVGDAQFLLREVNGFAIWTSLLSEIEIPTSEEDWGLVLTKLFKLLNNDFIQFLNDYATLRRLSVLAAAKVYTQLEQQLARANEIKMSELLSKASMTNYAEQAAQEVMNDQLNKDQISLEFYQQHLVSFKEEIVDAIYTLILNGTSSSLDDFCDVLVRALRQLNEGEWIPAAQLQSSSIQNYLGLGNLLAAQDQFARGSTVYLSACANRYRLLLEPSLDGESFSMINGRAQAPICPAAQITINRLSRMLMGDNVQYKIENDIVWIRHLSDESQAKSN